MSGIIDWEAFGAEDEDRDIEGVIEELDSGPGLLNVVEDLVLDLTLAAADWASGDFSGLIAFVPSMAINMVQMHTKTKDGERLLDWAESNGMNDDVAIEMKELRYELTRDFVDFFQAVVMAVPSTGDPSDDVASVAGGFMANKAVGALIGGFSATNVVPALMESFAGIWEDLLSKVPEQAVAVLEWRDPDTGFSLGGVFSDTLKMIAALNVAVERYKHKLQFVKLYGREPDELIDRIELEIGDLTMVPGSDEDEEPTDDVLDDEDDVDFSLVDGGDEDEDEDELEEDEDELEPDPDDVEALDLRSEGYSLMLAARCMAANGVQSPMVVQHLTELYATMEALADVAMDDSISEDALERDLDALILAVEMIVASLGSIEGEPPRQVALGIGGLCAMLVPLMWKIKDEGLLSQNLDEEVFLEIKEDVGNAIVLAEGSMDPYSEELGLDEEDMKSGSCGELDGEPSLDPRLSPEPVTPPVIDRQPETMQPMPDPMQPPAVAPGPDTPPRLEPVEDRGAGGGGGGAMAILLLGGAAAVGGLAWHKSRGNGRKKKR